MLKKHGFLDSGNRVHRLSRQLANVSDAATQDSRCNVVLAAGFGMRFRQVCPFLRSWAMFSPGSLVGGCG
jgi:hypothetical protein